MLANVKISRKCEAMIWVTVTCHTLSLAIFLYVVYIVHPSIQANWDNQIADIMNNSFRRACWSLAVCWMVFACVHGYGGPMNWFLSLWLWKFVARITYSMYLFHFLIQQVNLSAAVSLVYFDVNALFTAFSSDLVYTVVFSTAMCALVEEPVFTLRTMLLQGVFQQQKTKNEDKNKPLPMAEEDKERNAEV